MSLVWYNAQKLGGLSAKKLTADRSLRESKAPRLPPSVGAFLRTL